MKHGTSDEDLAAILLYHSKLSASKVLKGKWGWLYLKDDTNSFLEYQFGLKRWSSENINSAKNLLQKRAQYLEKRRALYHKFIVPEKSTVYFENLPDDIRLSAPASDIHHGRPAQELSKLQTVTYLNDVLQEGKLFDQVYFKGDSHPNFIGSYLIYRAIVRRLRALGFDIPMIELDQIGIDVIAYNGDLFDQAEPEFQTSLKLENPLGNYRWGYEIVKRISVDLPAHNMTREQISADYSRWFGRPTEVISRNAPNLPRAVIFRDSTSQFLVDLLAYSFSSCTFIWHGGYVIEDVIERENPDVVIHIQAERFLANLPFLSPTYAISDIDRNT